MNKDFHYYGTYYASRLAGFSQVEALEIAKAAQFVDELSHEKLKKMNIKNFDGPVTFMTVDELLYNLSNAKYKWSDEDIAKFREVWCGFHFLPGNMYNEQYYNGEFRHTGTLHNWTYSGADEKDFKLLCIKNSETAKEMVNMVNERHNAADVRLHLIKTGMCMHIYCDTWAHQNFLGLPRWFSNDITNIFGGNVFVYKNAAEGYKKADLFFSSGTDDINNLRFKHTPDMPSYESVAYLGHGRIGSIPDYASLSYRYNPHWSGGPYLRNNTEQFYEAFSWMYNALLCIRNGMDLFSVDLDERPFTEDVLPVLQTRKTDQSAEWAAMIQAVLNEAVPDYNEDEWFDNYKTLKGQGLERDSELFRFVEAAREQIDYVNALARAVR